MRTITLIILHCSAVRPGQQSSAKDIDNWHKSRVTRNSTHWKGIGYHFVVRRDGSVEKCRDIEEVGAHCVGHNRHSIGICYEGGLDASGSAVDTRTPAQKEALWKLVEELHQKFPRAVIVGHRDLDPNRDCPCFDAITEYRSLQPSV